MGDNTSSLIFDISALIGNLKGKAATLQKLIQRGLLADRREERLCQPRDSNETSLTAPRPLAQNPEYHIRSCTMSIPFSSVCSLRILPFLKRSIRSQKKSNSPAVFQGVCLSDKLSYSCEGCRLVKTEILEEGG